MTCVIGRAPRLDATFRCFGCAGRNSVGTDPRGAVYSAGWNEPCDSCTASGPLRQPPPEAAPMPLPGQLPTGRMSNTTVVVRTGCDRTTPCVSRTTAQRHPRAPDPAAVSRCSQCTRARDARGRTALAFVYRPPHRVTGSLK